MGRLVRGFRNRLFQLIALYAPGAETVRVALHRWRGVTIGAGTFIGTAAIIETERPDMVTIGANVSIGIRCVIIAHFLGMTGVTIEDDVFIGPGVIILPNVTVGRGAVVTAGSVVSSSVPPMTMVQGNPAKPVARCGIPLGPSTPMKEFLKHLKLIR